LENIGSDEFSQNRNAYFACKSEKNYCDVFLVFKLRSVSGIFPYTHRWYTLKFRTYITGHSLAVSMVLASRLHSVKPVKLVNMRQLEKQLLDKRLKDFQKEVIPDVLFPYLPCLIPEDKEEIQAKQNNHGPIKATALLVDRLKRRGDKAFPQFVQALRKCGGEHTALLLDPYYLVKGKPFDICPLLLGWLFFIITISLQDSESES